MEDYKISKTPQNKILVSLGDKQIEFETMEDAEDFINNRNSQTATATTGALSQPLANKLESLLLKVKGLTNEAKTK